VDLLMVMRIHSTMRGEYARRVVSLHRLTPDNGRGIRLVPLVEHVQRGDSHRHEDHAELALLAALRKTDERESATELARRAALFQGIVGFEATVIPQIENAILSGQDIIFLGERGQAKTRIARQLIELLDPVVPAIAGCEINDDPFAPICAACKYRVANDGDAVELVWLTPDLRYSEKLATPDISIADLIGEVDPIKVAEGRYLSDELTIHYGLVPRTHRGIF